MQIHARRGSGLRLRGVAPSADTEPFREALGESLRLCGAVIPSEAGAIVLGDRPGSLRAAVAFGGGARRLVNGHVPAAHNWMTRCLMVGPPTLLHVPKDEPYFPLVAKHTTRSAIAVSLRIGGETLGAIQLVNPQNKKRFGAADKKLLGALAKQTATALANARALVAQQSLALHDPLTGLRNIRNFDKELVRAIRSAQRRDSDLAIMFVDVDRLKRINTRLGHSAGSEALRRTGAALAEASSGTAETFRFGGDEFVVMQPGATVDSTKALAEHVRAHIAASTKGAMRFGGNLPQVTVSVGVATLLGSLRPERSKPKTTMVRMLGAADRALYRAKAEGRNRVVLATKRDDRLKD